MSLPATFGRHAISLRIQKKIKKPMKKVFSANNLMEAHLVLDLLEHAYISARLFNEHAQGVMGEIPFTHAYPEVWVIRDEDYVRGREVVSAYEQTPIETGTIRCPTCGEESPQNFQLCWQCGAGLESVLYKNNTPNDAY
jgi:putative signal transducing protein